MLAMLVQGALASLSLKPSLILTHFLFDSSCCSMSLYKLEIVISSSLCKGISITIDGANKPPAYAIDTYPSGIPTTAPYAVLKVSVT